MNIPLGIPSFPAAAGQSFSVSRFLANTTLKYIPEGWPSKGRVLRLPQVVLLSAASYATRPERSSQLWLSKPRNSWQPEAQWISDPAPTDPTFVNSYLYASLATVTTSSVTGSNLLAGTVMAEVRARIEAARPGITFVVTDASQVNSTGASAYVDSGDTPIPIATDRIGSDYRRRVIKVFTPNILVVHVGVPYFDLLDCPWGRSPWPFTYDGTPFENGLGFRDNFVASVGTSFPSFASRVFDDGVAPMTTTLSGVDLSPLAAWVDYNGNPPTGFDAYVNSVNQDIQRVRSTADNPIPSSASIYSQREADFRSNGIDYKYLGQMTPMNADTIVGLIADHYGFKAP